MASDPRVDELRQRLRSLGYLDAGVTRFVLGPTRGTRRPAAIALLSSVRVGLLAAILLGPAAAIGLAARMPGLVTGPRDATIVALYLGALFGLAMACASFVAGLLVALFARGPAPRLARHGQRWSRAAGAVVGLLCLAYLTLWWQTVIADIGWSAPVWTLTVLAVAAGISLLLGHAVSIMSSALLVATVDSSVSARKPSWKTSLAAGVVAFAGAALLLTASGGSNSDDATTPSPLAVIPSGLRVRVIALDGFDPTIFDELSAAGRVPALMSLFRGAVVSLAPESHEPADPARVWTTIATGQPAAVHGVRGLETRRVAGMSGSVSGIEQSPLARTISGVTDVLRLTRPSIASRSERRAKTFWEVASDAGLRTSVVNWWATWPARGDSGIVLTDRATLRLEHGGALDAEVSPPALYDDLRSRYPELKTRATEMARVALAGGILDAEIHALLQRSAELDALQLVLISAVSRPDTDLSIVYLPGLDIAQHLLLGGERAGVAASTLGARLDAVKSYYDTIDRLLAVTKTAEPGADELVILLTEPGRVSAGDGARMAARGAALSAGRVTTGVTTGIAPTILYALGVPIARDLAGPPLQEIFTERFRTMYPVRVVDRYGQPAATSESREGKPLDQEMIDRLRSLGYVR